MRSQGRRLAVVSLAELEADPYPLLARHRAVTPVVDLPELDALLVLRWADVGDVVSSSSLYRSDQPDSHLTRFVGPNMLHSEGQEHRGARSRMLPAFRSLSPELFANIKTRYAALRDAQPHDLVSDYCIPVVADATIDLLGLEDRVSTEQMTRWSPLVSQGAFDFHAFRGQESDIESARREIDDVATHFARGHWRARPDTVVGCSADVSPDELSRLIQFMIIGADAGPREGLSTIVSCTLSLEQPDRQKMQASPALRQILIDEALRWESPIGGVTRRTRVEVELDGHRVPGGQRVLGALGSANRDPARWPRPDEFLLDRGDRAHLSFGAGMHGCIGAAVTRKLADAVIELAAADTQLRLVGEPRFRGWWYRGPDHIPVSWDLAPS